MTQIARIPICYVLDSEGDLLGFYPLADEHTATAPVLAPAPGADMAQPQSAYRAGAAAAGISNLHEDRNK
jgi:hypothetical protein